MKTPLSVSWITTGISAVTRPVGEALLPQHCTACRRPCEEWLCAECGVELNDLACEPRCEVCGLPLALPDAPCPRCMGRPRRLIRRLARLGRHDGVLRDLIHRMKYSHHWTLAGPLAQQLRQQITVEAILADADLIAPVPLHWRRRVSRGYNQSELLAKELARGTDAKLASLLQRIRNTPHQTAIRSLSQRARNVRDAFRCKAKAGEVTGKSILLIDDVYTTGATLRAAAKALKAAGAGPVDAIVIAVADPKNRGFATISA